MLIYNLNLCLIIGMFIYSEIKKDKLGIEENTFSRLLIFLSLWLVSGFRDMVGTDFYAYKMYFENIHFYSWNYPYFEKGYYVLNYLISLMTPNPQYVFLMISFITIYLINRTLKEQSVSYTLSVFLFVAMYFYYNSFNIMRQYIAVSMIFYSIKYILNKNLMKYLVIVTIASFFHISALLMIPFYWALRVKFHKIVYLIMLVATLGLSFFTPNIVSLMSNIFVGFNVYTIYSMEGASANSIILITSVVLIFSFINKNKMLKISENNLVYINCVYFALLFSILARENILFFRIAIYFYIFCLLLIPICIKSMNKKLRPSAYIFIVAIFTFYSTYLLLNNNAGVYPYKFNLDIFYSDESSGLLIALGISLLFLIDYKIISLFKQKNMNKVPYPDRFG